jgi:hypothetical protein
MDNLRILKNMVLRKLSDSKRDELIEDRRKLYNEGLHKLYLSQNVTKTIVSRNIRSELNVSRVGRTEQRREIVVRKI